MSDANPSPSPIRKRLYAIAAAVGGLPKTVDSLGSPRQQLCLQPTS